MFAVSICPATLLSSSTDSVGSLKQKMNEVVASGAASCLICYSAVKRANPVSLHMDVSTAIVYIHTYICTYVCNMEKGHLFCPRSIPSCLFSSWMLPAEFSCDCMVSLTSLINHCVKAVYACMFSCDCMVSLTSLINHCVKAVYAPGDPVNKNLTPSPLQNGWHHGRWCGSSGELPCFYWPLVHYFHM